MGSLRPSAGRAFQVRRRYPLRRRWRAGCRSSYSLPCRVRRRDFLRSNVQHCTALIATSLRSSIGQRRRRVSPLHQRYFGTLRRRRILDGGELGLRQVVIVFMRSIRLALLTVQGLDGDACDSRIFFAIANSVERGGPGTDGANAEVAKPLTTRHTPENHCQIFVNSGESRASVGRVWRE